MFKYKRKNLCEVFLYWCYSTLGFSGQSNLSEITNTHQWFCNKLCIKTYTVSYSAARSLKPDIYKKQNKSALESKYEDKHHYKSELTKWQIILSLSHRHTLTGRKALTCAGIAGWRLFRSLRCLQLSLSASVRVKHTKLYVSKFCGLQIIPSMMPVCICREAACFYHVSTQLLSHSLDGVSALGQQCLIQTLFRLFVGCLTEKRTDIHVAWAFKKDIVTCSKTTEGNERSLHTSISVQGEMKFD